MTAFLTGMGTVVAEVAKQFGTIGAQIIGNEVIQLVIGLSVFSYLFNKSLRLIKQIRRG